MNKYKEDSFYKVAFNILKDHNLMTKGGYIEEKRSNYDRKNTIFDKSTKATPLNKLSLKRGVVNKVILSTGSFAPMHEGHIKMMEHAKEKLQSKGLHVAGGYMSPSHDMYVLTKNGVDMDAMERVDVIEKRLEKSNWLSIDKWEALFTPVSSNFTTVIERMESLLSFYYPEFDIDVVYAFGGDNIEFSYAFAGKGEFVCVQRYDNEKILNENFIVDESRMHYVKGSQNDISSTQIRKSRLKSYMIRDDVELSTDIEVNKEDKNKLFSIISEYNGIPATIIDVKDQIEMTKTKLKGKKTISLDLYFKGDMNLDLCREFKMCDEQIYPISLIHRKFGDIEISPQGEHDYVLVDDDRASGNTESMAIEILSAKGINVKEKFYMNELFMDGKIVKDIVDARDFILGAKYSGLCITLPNGMIARCLYVYPYVNLETRASIPKHLCKKMSIDIWKWNLSMVGKMKVKDAHFLSRNWLNHIGFSDDTLLEHICEQHINQLEVINGL